MDDSDRLDSWKQIAAYLRKSERTVRRWQEKEGLPVHRHVHQQRGSVWAYKAEVDAWLERRQLGPEPLVDVPPPGPNGRLTPPLVTVFVLAGVALITVIAVLLFRAHQPVPAIREPVQMTAFPGPCMEPPSPPIVSGWYFTGRPHRIVIRAFT